MINNSKVTPKGKNIKSIETFKASSVTNTSNVDDKERTTMEENILNPRADGILI
jgi:hypothetical protein